MFWIFSFIGVCFAFMLGICIVIGRDDDRYYERILKERYGYKKHLKKGLYLWNKNKLTPTL